MIKLYEVLYGKLSSLHNRVFEVHRVPQVTTFPYITFSIASNTDLEQMDRVIVEIDIWDKQKNNYDVLRQVETLTNVVESNMKKYKFFDAEIGVRFEYLNRLNFEPDDENVHRRQLRLEARTFFIKT
jgi:predicted transcriptional regulator